MKRAPLAPSDSLLGQLQRGRGLGFLRAASAPRREVCAALVECITVDRRCTPEFEPRAGYYARLALAHELELGILERHLRENDDREDVDEPCKAYLTVQTLGSLAVMGSDEAARILRDYVGHGFWWGQVLVAFEELPEASQGLDHVLSARFSTDDELKTALRVHAW